MENTKVTMTLKEIKRVEVMKLIESGTITGEQASEMLGVSLSKPDAAFRNIVQEVQAIWCM